ncbi:Diphthamide biosynthesis protein 4 [Naviculisporaceae sp. PSN 640]
MSTPRQPNYYDILSLTPSSIDDAYLKGGETSSTQLIKRAYRRALLSHHPDKQQHQQNASHPTTKTTNTNLHEYTIDQISQAYAILSSPTQRSLYDRQLKLQNSSSSTDSSSSSNPQQSQDLFQTGIENIDLDDLESFDETSPQGEPQTKWYRSCRCGNPRGYLFSESDLEDAADLGELMVGCADCSLWLRVHFAVLEDEEDEAEQVPGGQTSRDDCHRAGDRGGGCCGMNLGGCGSLR